METELRRQAEEEIRRRVEAIRLNVEAVGGAYDSMEELFRQKPAQQHREEVR
jgi:hypothetical protein